MLLKARVIVIVLGTLLMLLGVAIGGLFLFNARLGASLLVASWKTLPGGIGIPGLTKTYEANLTNRGTLPVRVKACDYVTDAHEHGKSVAYSVESWDQSSGTWRFFWGVPLQEFCQPQGLDITSDSKVRSVWLWPQQSISTDFVAVQAIDGLQLNDRLRFAITPFLGHADVAVVTPPFRVDEHPTEPTSGLRIRH